MIGTRFVPSKCFHNNSNARSGQGWYMPECELTVLNTYILELYYSKCIGIKFWTKSMLLEVIKKIHKIHSR